MQKIIFGTILLLAALHSHGQLTLRWQPTDADSLSLAEQYKWASTFPDSLSLQAELRRVIQALQGDAYLLASIDSVEIADSIWTVQLYRGAAFQVARIENGNVPDLFLQQANVRSRRFRDRPLNYPEILRQQERILAYAENNGYPFARIGLDSLELDGSALSAQWRLETGPLILFDTLEIKGDARISRAYLQNYLGIREGMPYSREKVLRIQDRLSELAFLRARQNATVFFSEKKARLQLELEPRKASRFDFLLGILPTNDAGPGRRFLITGTLNAELQNQFGWGEQFALSFEQLRPGTQELELAFSYPYVLQLPFGVDVGFNQYKRDSTYTDVIFDAGVRYLFAGGNYLKAFWLNTGSSLISVDEQQVINQRALPATLDVSNRSFGLELNWQQLDYRYNPRQGWGFRGRAAAGFKTIEPNQQINQLNDPSDPEFDFASLYDTLTLRTLQYRGNARLEGFLPLFSSSTLMGRWQGGWVNAPTPIYRNEQFRIGGNRLLRGFDEESIFSTFYSVWTLEYRLLFARNSNFYLFGDYAYTEDITTSTRIVDRPYGFGAGMTFETAAGIFSISLAVGSQRGNPLEWQNPKLHFGYVSVF